MCVSGRCLGTLRGDSACNCFSPMLTVALVSPTRLGVLFPDQKK